MILLAGILTATAALAGCSSTDGTSTTKKSLIKLTDLNWGSAHFQSEMAKIMIEKGYDYPVELVPGATIPLTQGLRTGDVDVMIEGWYQNQKEAIDAGIADGEIDMLGYLNNDNTKKYYQINRTKLGQR